MVVSLNIILQFVSLVVPVPDTRDSAGSVADVALERCEFNSEATSALPEDIYPFTREVPPTAILSAHSTYWFRVRPETAASSSLIFVGSEEVRCRFYLDTSTEDPGDYVSCSFEPSESESVSVYFVLVTAKGLECGHAEVRFEAGVHIGNGLESDLRKRSAGERSPYTTITSAEGNSEAAAGPEGAALNAMGGCAVSGVSGATSSLSFLILGLAILSFFLRLGVRPDKFEY